MNLWIFFENWQTFFSPFKKMCFNHLLTTTIKQAYWFEKKNRQAKFLEGFFGSADSAQPLVGCLDVDIVFRCQWSDQSEDITRVTQHYGFLTGRRRVVPGFHPPIGGQADGRNIPQEILLACSLLDFPLLTYMTFWQRLGCSNLLSFLEEVICRNCSGK